MPTSSKSTRPNHSNSSWQTPKGVEPGSWDYVRSGQIAQHYDEFLENDPLTQLDWQIISSYVPDACQELVAADFGCGTGRHIGRFIEQGFTAVLAIDLSMEMLRVVVEKFSQNSLKSSSEQNGRVVPIQSNLVELNGLVNDSVDFGICMFSTLGMIKGRENRLEFLSNVRRVSKPGGTFVVHAHNYWFNLRHPGGARWIVNSVAGSLAGKNEIGDRVADYRSIKNMFIHSFSFRGLRKELSQAGLSIRNVHALRPGGTEIDTYRAFDFLRTVGWVVVCDIK